MAETAAQKLYLFRYRDLVADTLEEHRRVLRQHSYCWWGWWKRPSEPSRTEVWDDLREQLREAGKVQIALFDSGSGIARLAVVSEVIEPRMNDFGYLEYVSPPEAEAESIPRYYRASTFSRAWLRIVGIADDPLDLFSGYSYAVPPPLPGFAESQLRQFEHKRLVDANELRAMDSTIWAVRRALAIDSRETVLTARPRLHDSLDPRPIQCTGEWLLHITDLHFATDRFRSQHAWRLDSEQSRAAPTMFDAVTSALHAHRRSVGAVLLTGDLTFVSSPSEFDEARSALLKFVTGELGIGLEHLVVIPGNHDIAWTATGSYDDAAPVDAAPQEATADYRGFFETLFGYQANDNLSMARRFVFPGGSVVDIVAVNSSSLEQGANFLAGMGRVQEHALAEALGILEWSRAGTGLRILALHHHVSLMEDLENYGGYATGFGIAIDAPRILRLAARHGVHLILHGHKHRAFIWRSLAYELPDKVLERWPTRAMNILGGGSLGSSDVDAGRHFFNLMRLEGSRIRLEVYRAEWQGAFERIGTWLADLEGTPGEVSRVGEWRKE